MGLGLQQLGVWVCNVSFPEIHLSYDFTKVSLGNLFNEGGLAFWAFVVIFAIKTLVTLIYNYITRKLIIFREPKKKEEDLYAKPSTLYPLVVTAVDDENKKPVDDRPHYTTKESFAKMLHEETDAILGKGKYRVNESDARRLINEELEAFEREHPTKKK